MFVEKNTKENETFIYYLQWTGNEDALTRLEKLVEGASYDDLYGGDYSQVSLDTSIKIPQQVVDIQCNVHETINMYHPLFTKCVGTFTCPISDKELEENEHERARILDEMFYPCKIVHMFK